MTPLRLAYFGTAGLARPILEALADQPGFEVVAVVTQPDKPAGRDLRLQPSPVKQEAVARGLPVLQPQRARHPDFVRRLAEVHPDLIVVAAYGQLLPQDILDLPRFGCVNVHTSLLPRHRGAAPIQWAILEDDPETGVTIMKMDAGLDTGDILTQERTPIGPSDNAQSLHDRLAQMGADLLVRTIPGYTSGQINPRPQPTEGVTYARKITKEDGRLDWPSPARALWNRVRAFTPWPGAFTLLPNASKQPLLKIWQADVVEEVYGDPGELLRADKAGLVIACGTGSLRVQVLQREGGRRLTAQEFLAGHPLAIGTKFA